MTVTLAERVLFDEILGTIAIKVHLIRGSNSVTLYLHPSQRI